ncbi:Glutathione-regulated potassium-efflux system protein KefB [uncultured archaeon]|nr:Glutathione-regulated potassium-efflux system protein KefB [uncultured archaeon]
MDAGFVVGLSVIIIMLFGLLMERFRLPMVLGILMAGALMGPASPLKDVHLGPLDLGALVLQDSSTVESFALLGSVLILFGIGLEFSIVKLAKTGLSVFLAAFIKLGLTYLAGYLVATFMGMNTAAAVLLGFMLSFSSTPIIIKILEGSGKLRRPEATFIIAVLILEDLAAVALLGIMANTGLSDNYAVAWSLFKVAVAFVVAYLALSRLMRWLLSMVEHSDELLVLFSVGMVLLVSYACSAFGLGFSVGSFLAGSAVAATPEAKRIIELIRPFNALFVSFFFFSIGMLVDGGAAAQAWPFLLGLLLVAVVGKMIASAASAYLIGFSGQSAAFAASALLPMGELSLLIGAAAASQGLLPAGLVGLLALVIVLTSVTSVALVGRESEVYNMGRDVMPSLVLRNMSSLRSTSIGMQRAVEENSRYDRIISRIPSVGAPAYTSHDRLGRALANTALFGVLASVFLMAWRLLMPIPDSPPSLFYLVLFFGFFILATFTLVNVSSALRIYTRLLRNSGRMGIEGLVHFGASILFAGLLMAVWLAALLLSERSLLILLAPLLLLGFVHLKTLAERLRIAALGWAR